MRWLVSHRADPPARMIADRHYNRQKIGHAQFVPPGRCLVLISDCGKAVWVTSYPYAEHVKHAWGGAWVNSLFRNEGLVLSSELIKQAVAATRAHWPDIPEKGMITFVNADKTKRKRDPGRCYRKAGFKVAGMTKGGLHALQMLPHEMPAPQPARKKNMTDLAPVQLEAITRANGRRGFAYFMDMGLGKTLTALTEFKTLRMCGAAQRMVVICPNSFKGGWDSEIMKHRTGLVTMVYESVKTFKPSPRLDVLVINYEAVRTDKGLQAIKDFVLPGYDRGEKAYLVLDESIKLKNRNSKQTQAIIGRLYKGQQRGGITGLFAYVRLLSGKPMTQGPHDLWPQLVAINEMSMSFYGFQARFCRLGGWQDRQVVGVLNEEELQEGLAKVSFQAKKRDWLKGLPPKVYSTRRYELTGALLRHYEEMREDFLTYLRSEVVSVQIAVTKYEKLAQIMCGFIIKEGGEVEQLVEAEHNPRLTLLQELLDEEVTGKAVIVYRHKHAGLMLGDLWPGPELAWIRGGLSPEEIAHEKFKFDGPAKIMLLQADAGKYGHTLVGTPDDPCGTMIFFENTYSLDTRSQIEDRIHRMGAVAESCLYVDLSGSDLDQRIVRALQRKENMFKAVFPQFQEATHDPDASRQLHQSALHHQDGPRG